VCPDDVAHFDLFGLSDGDLHRERDPGAALDIEFDEHESGYLGSPDFRAASASNFVRTSMRKAN
jgi:hypothetical protein